MPKLLEARPLANYRLHLRYDDGEAGDVDLRDLAGRGVFAAWLKPGAFEQARVIDQSAVQWPGDIDLCADALYLQLTAKPPEQLFPNLARIRDHA